MKKNILIIGGSSGIGRAFADILSPQHNIYVVSRTNESLANAAVTHLTHDVLNDELNVDNFTQTAQRICVLPRKHQPTPLGVKPASISR